MPKPMVKLLAVFPVQAFDSVLSRLTASCSHLKSLIKTTSVLTAPRERTNCVPSRDQAKSKMRSVLKSVNGTGFPLFMGWLQRLETPLRVSM
jgi:hypothetical protein